MLIKFAKKKKTFFRQFLQFVRFYNQNYEFLTLKDDVKNDRGYFYSINHYINEEVDKTEDRKLDYSDDKEWEKFKKETHYGEKCL